MANPTALKFGHPRTLVAETEHWQVLVRPQQPTLGSCVLICKNEAQAFSQIGPAAFADLATAVAGVETMLSAFVHYQKINYLMLMMVDPDVHFHVIPRYEGAREYGGMSFPDAGWPAQPNLGANIALDEAMQATLARDLSTRWPRG